MLNVVGMGSVCCAVSSATPEKLFKANVPFNFYIEAPLYWWLDFDYTKFGFELGDFSEKEKLTMPVDTPVKGVAVLTYQEIIEVCEDYVNGVFQYNKDDGHQWPAEREWKDFSETLLDIKGVRDFVTEEK